MRRRDFLKLSSSTATYLALPVPLSGLGTKTPGSFQFAFITDTHIRPDLDAPHGCEMAFDQARASRPDFVIQGGDLVVDAMAANRNTAEELFDLYDRVEKASSLPMYHVVGNHDLFGIDPSSGVSPTDPLFGKGLYKQRFGSTYSSFDHKGYHFVILDSLQVLADRDWESRIDAVQLTWLAEDLKQQDRRTPVVIVTHVPLVTGAASYAKSRPEKTGHIVVANAFEVLAILQQHHVVAVLQGHTHINEVVQYHGISYISCGAVCGNWWHGTRWGTPEGFTVVTLRAGQCSWQYRPTGFRSVDPQNT
jgi:3',5'-cyclic-AMP phosphodiesterase